jgi:hypothetical protein
MSEPAANDLVEVLAFGGGRQELSMDVCGHIAVLVDLAVLESDFQALLGRVVSDDGDRLGLNRCSVHGQSPLAQRLRQAFATRFCQIRRNLVPLG